MGAGKSTINTTLFSGTSAESLTKVCKIKSYPDLGSAPNTLQTTDLEDTSHTYTFGVQDTGSLEFTANYRTRKFTADLNLTWTHTFESNILLKDINDNNNTPDIMSNIVIGWQLTPHLKIHSHILFEGRQRTYNYDLV